MSRRGKWVALACLIAGFYVVGRAKGAESPEVGGAPMRIKGFHVSFEVSDLPRAVAFYSRVFGKAPDYELERCVGYVLADGVALNLERKEMARPVEHLTIAVDGIADLFRRFEADGLPIHQAPVRAPDGHAILGKIRDPDGNVLVFAE